jgi:hypothetical protein
MLSQDLFRKKSHLSVYCSGDTPPNHRQLIDAKVIYCNSDYAEEFLGSFKEHIRAQVLIFGNSDRDFPDFPSSIPNSVKRIFLQNSTFTDSKFRVLPIGIENLSIAMNGRAKFFKEEFISQKKMSKALVGPVSMTHAERNIFSNENWLANSKIKFQQNWMPPARYAMFSSQYQYILCPRGNGFDTHRFWETLYRGSIPVVKASPWAVSIQALGIPLLQINEWTPEEVLDAITHSEYREILPSSIPSLWWNYWDEEIKNFIS